MNLVVGWKVQCLVLLFGIFISIDLGGIEWKKEVLNHEEQVSFILRSADEEEKFLGTLIKAKDTAENGKKMVYDKYFYEAVPLQSEHGEEFHIHKAKLEPTAREWIEDDVFNHSFSEYVWTKYTLNPEFAKMICERNVRYFSDEESEQTKIVWVDGILWQIGLDSEVVDTEILSKGEYAFVLGQEHLYMTPKVKTTKGRIHHSSFLRGGPVRSAGIIKVGNEGEIIWLKNQSGHYHPGDQEVTEILDFLRSKMSEEQFDQIWVRVRVSDDYSLNPVILKNSVKNEIEIDVPISTLGL